MMKWIAAIMALLTPVPAIAQVQFNRTLFEWRGKSPFAIVAGYTAFTAAGFPANAAPSRTQSGVMWWGMHDSVVSGFGMSASYFVFPFCIIDNSIAQQCKGQSYRNAIIINQQTPNYSYMEYYQGQYAPYEHCTYNSYEGWGCKETSSLGDTRDAGFAQRLVYGG